MISATVQEHQKALFELLCELDRICSKHNIKYTLFAGTLLGAVRHQGFIPWDDDADVIMLREDYEKFMKIAPQELDGLRFFLQEEHTEHWPMFFSKMRLNGTACIEKYIPKDYKTHMGVYIDIFPCDWASNIKFVRKLQFFASKIIVAKSLFCRGYSTDSKMKKFFMQICRTIPMRFLRAIVLGKKNGNKKYVHSFLSASRKYKKNVFPRKWFEEIQQMNFWDKKFMVTKHYDDLLTLLYGDYMILPSESERACKVHTVIVDLKNSYEVYAEYQKNMKIKEFTRSIR